MKVRLVLLALIFTAFSCNTKINEEDNIPTSKTELLTELADDEDSIKTAVKTENVVVQSQNNFKPILIARGSEPGWYAEFFKDHLRLLVDYGKDSVFVESDFTNIAKIKIYNSSFTKATTGKGVTKIIALTINIDEKTCVEAASGDKQDRTISIKFNDKIYKGCAFNP